MQHFSLIHIRLLRLLLESQSSNGLLIIFQYLVSLLCIVSSDALDDIKIILALSNICDFFISLLSLIPLFPGRSISISNKLISGF